jgi:hypothetical protein
MAIAESTDRALRQTAAKQDRNRAGGKFELQ